MEIFDRKSGAENNIPQYAWREDYEGVARFL